jgi:hypothetical protein
MDGASALILNEADYITVQLHAKEVAIYIAIR